MNEGKRNGSLGADLDGWAAEALPFDHNVHPDNLLADLSFELLPIEALKPLSGHARKPGKRALETLKRSISELSFVFPIVADEDGRIIAGHLRHAAAKAIGMTKIPVVRARGLSEAVIQQLNLADNKLPTLSSFEEAALKAQFQLIVDLDPEVDFTTLGFEVGEIDVLLDLSGEPAADAADEIPEEEDFVVSREGDVFELGRHLLTVGDGRDEGLLRRLVAGAASAAFLDPPYNVPIAGNVSGLGRKTHADFAMAVGEQSPAEFTEFLAESLGSIAAVCRDGAVIFTCMDWRHMREMLDAGERAGLVLINLCIWNKTNAGMGSSWRSQHELVFVFRKGDVAHTNNVRLGAGGRYRTNIWIYPGANTFHRGREQDLADHPTVKPTALVTDALKDVTRRGDFVLDTFLGSGTTLIAAERAGRRCVGVELEPRYVDVAIRRFAALFPDVPITLRDTGESFDALRRRREDDRDQDDRERWNIL